MARKVFAPLKLHPSAPEQQNAEQGMSDFKG
jgi:hypothetical protein